MAGRWGSLFIPQIEALPELERELLTTAGLQSSVKTRAILHGFRYAACDNSWHLESWRRLAEVAFLAVYYPCSAWHNRSLARLAALIEMRSYYSDCTDCLAVVHMSSCSREVPLTS